MLSRLVITFLPRSKHLLIPWLQSPFYFYFLFGILTYGYQVGRWADKLGGWDWCVYTTDTMLLSHVWLFVTPWTVALQAPLSLGFFRQEYCSGLPFPPSVDLPNPGIKSMSPVFLHCRWVLHLLSHRGNPWTYHLKCILCVYVLLLLLFAKNPMETQYTNYPVICFFCLMPGRARFTAVHRSLSLFLY